MCTTGIYFCIGLYGVAKLFTYLFLCESLSQPTRWKSLNTFFKLNEPISYTTRRPHAHVGSPPCTFCASSSCCCMEVSSATCSLVCLYNHHFVLVLTFTVHIAYIREDGVCMIGIAMDGVIMIVVFDVCVRV